jgi:hypothetical protein
MSPNPDSAPDADSMFALMETNDGDVIIFDRDRPDAWLQSDTTVDVSK